VGARPPRFPKTKEAGWVEKFRNAIESSGTQRLSDCDVNPFDQIENIWSMVSTRLRTALHRVRRQSSTWCRVCSTVGLKSLSFWLPSVLALGLSSPVTNWGSHRDEFPEGEVRNEIGHNSAQGHAHDCHGERDPVLARRDGFGKDAAR